MIAVIFEVEPVGGEMATYLDLAAGLSPMLNELDGFISVERFESLSNPGKMLSLSFFRDEYAVMQWRNLAAHRSAQDKGRSGVFRNYRLRVAHVLRDYGLADRSKAPKDSREAHDHDSTT